jgi:Reverse transcriptase (RNA-dependent DNA polymerase)
MVIIVLVHVDDCMIAATTIMLIERFKKEIAKHVEITDLGELHWLLGIEIRCDQEKRTIHLSQCSYIDSILHCYNLQDLKPIYIPMEISIHLLTSQSPATTAEFAQMRDVPYHEAIGSLMYASLRTRPDISFAVQTVSRFSTKPGFIHWDAIKRIFWYLKGTKDLWLSFGHAKIDLAGYADADGSMAKDRHAISGYAFIVHGGAVSWSAKRQEIVSLSTTESKYMAVTHAAKEALWLRSLIHDPTTFWDHPITHHTLLRQSICHHTFERSPVSCPYQTHRHPISFHPLDH